MRKILIIDTSILCVMLQIPSMDTCGPDHDKWDTHRVNTKIRKEEKNGTIFVLPLASIIETGNHISQATGDRSVIAQRLTELMKNTADEKTPWAAFGDQAQLWSPAQIKALAKKWPPLAAQKLSLGDATIAEVAEYYAKMGFNVEVLTGDQGLKAHEPTRPVERPRRQK